MNINLTAVGQSISFAVFVFVCMKYIWPPIMNAIENREKEISNSIKEIEIMNKKIKISETNIEKKINQAKIEAQNIIYKANDMYLKILKEADNERKKIINQASIEIEKEYKKSYEDLYKKINFFSIKVAEKILENSINTKIDDKFIDNVISKL